MSYAQNQVPSEVQLSDLLTLWAKSISLKLNCHHVGTIESFDSAQQTATVKIVYKQTYFQPQGVSDSYDPVLKDYPLLADVPLIFLGGGASRLTFPVTAGDECLLFFNDRDIDDWFSGAKDAGNPTPRLHSISDAFALVGVRSLPEVLTDFSAARAELATGDDAKVYAASDSSGLEFGDSMVRVKAKIHIANASQDLKTNLDALFVQLGTLCDKLTDITTALALLTVTCAAPTNPSSVPINAADFTAAGSGVADVKTEINNIKNDIGALLE